MRLIDADALASGRVENDPVVIAAKCADTIDAAPVAHGRWIIRHDGPYGRRRGYCSVCENHSGIGGIIKNQTKPYCPNCGAKMDLSDGKA